MWLKTTRMVARTALRDLKGFYKFGKYMAYCGSTNRRKDTVPQVFRQVVAQHPQKTMFIFDEQRWTFGEAEEFTNKIANYFTSLGFKAGDDVALMMENRPELVLVWLGLSKIGVSTALLNTNLRGASLLHCTKCVKSKAIIFSPRMAPHIEALKGELSNGTVSPDLLCLPGAKESKGDSVPGKNILQDLMLAPSELPKLLGKSTDPFLYVYTSGTTGMPKAALLRHSRYFLIAGAARFFGEIRGDDISYCFLPLYHFAGGVMQISQTVSFGTTAVIVGGFSATNFWKDCIKYNCTYFQYVGEICRYLYIQPESPEDRKHSVRVVIGNGIKPQIWEEFKERFGITHIREIYGATEGNGSLMNVDEKTGAVGFVPALCRFSETIKKYIYRRYFIRIDAQTGKPIRGEDGLCIQVGPNEPGEYVAEINNNVESQFDGYTDPEATKKKIYYDVIRKGDKCFASGDVLLYDEDGYIYFKDRTGDTFRWKGENIATAEVEGVLSKHADYTDCVVFGVEVPHHEGKAGMAILSDPNRKVDVQRLLKDASKELPSYSLPLFLRISDQLESTGTFKLQKTKAVNEGFDLKKVADPIYFLDLKQMSYVPLNNTIVEQISSGKLRL